MASASSVIFPTGSPVDRAAGPLLAPTFRRGRLRDLAKLHGSLLETRKIMDKVYSNGYFGNHYPEAEKLLKQSLHERAMQSWAGLKEGKLVEHSEPDGDEGINLNITINLGK